MVEEPLLEASADPIIGLEVLTVEKEESIELMEGLLPTLLVAGGEVIEDVGVEVMDPEVFPEDSCPDTFDGNETIPGRGTPPTRPELLTL